MIDSGRCLIGAAVTDEFSITAPASYADGQDERRKARFGMRKICSWLFMSLDGVVESPEKWVRFNDEVGRAIDAEMQAADALLLGRQTYEVFAAAWPQRTADDDPAAPWMNEAAKYVVSTTLRAPQWQNTTVIDGDVVERVTELKRQSATSQCPAGARCSTAVSNQSRSERNHLA